MRIRTGRLVGGSAVMLLCIGGAVVWYAVVWPEHFVRMVVEWRYPGSRCELARFCWRGAGVDMYGVSVSGAQARVRVEMV
ncbi:MAG: hypothetical protein N2595_02570, partial [bacterium]|nr:hypothetical protein [bacterium]